MVDMLVWSFFSQCNSLSETAAGQVWLKSEPRKKQNICTHKPTKSKISYSTYGEASNGIDPFN